MDTFGPFLGQVWRSVQTDFQFRIEAEFVSLEDDRITLRKTDGKVLRLPIDKLSIEDRKIARELAAGGRSSGLRAVLRLAARP
jgi:hypothetical protein